MKILSIDKIDTPVVMTIGSFDGIHLGHKSLLELLVLNSKKLGYKSLLISFDPHPRKIIRSDSKINLLTSFDERKEIFNELGIDYFSIIDFDREIANMSFSDFYEKKIFRDLNIKHIVTGFNHEFGKGREGNFEKLQSMCGKYGIETTSVGPSFYKGRNISSTRIREAILQGALTDANEMLGHTYFLIGKVLKGKGIGNKIGFPTANIKLINSDKILPLNGVYFTKTTINNKTYFSMTNIGNNPTFGDDRVTIETHIFNFDEDIYDHNIKVSFISRIREEIKFNNSDELIKMLVRDREKCILLSKNYK